MSKNTVRVYDTITKRYVESKRKGSYILRQNSVEY